MTFQFKQHKAYYTFGTHIKIGCHWMTIDEWQKSYKKIGKQNNYSKEEIAEYGAFIKRCKKLQIKETEK